MWPNGQQVKRLGNGLNNSHPVIVLCDWPADFRPDLEYVRDLLLWLNHCVIECLAEDRVAQAEAWLAVMESLRQHLDLYCRTLEK